MDLCLTWFSCCCWPATPGPFSQTQVGDSSAYNKAEGEGDSIKTQFNACTNVCIGLGMVPLPDTAIDFSDLRSQSSRMNERVRKQGIFTVIFLFRCLDILFHLCH